jgi:NCAIR mutase (PurE)-related protein
LRRQDRRKVNKPLKVKETYRGFFMVAQCEIEVERTPDYWLIVLLRAARNSDLPLAAEAQQRLREMGVEVRFANMLREPAPCK